MTMKTLNVLRTVFAIVSLLFMLLYFFPVMKGGYDWMMIAVLILFVVLIPAALISNIRMDKFPHILPSKGALKFNIYFSIFLGIASAVCVVVRIINGLSPWMYVAAVFAFASVAVNNIIHLKVKVQADEDKA